MIFMPEGVEGAIRLSIRSDEQTLLDVIVKNGLATICEHVLQGYREMIRMYLKSIFEVN
jgi:hypothetical protein